MIINNETAGGIKTNDLKYLWIGAEELLDEVRNEYIREYKGEFIGGNMFKFEIGDKVSYKGKEYKVSGRYFMEDSASRIYYELKNDNECTGLILESDLVDKKEYSIVIMKDGNVESVIYCDEIDVSDTYLRGNLLSDKIISINCRGFIMNKLIYVGGKYGGLQQNKELIENVIKHLINHDKENEISDKVYISPIHTFGHLYEETDYLEGIEYCLSLLNKCDEIYLLDNWGDSRGANMEYSFALAKDIPITIIDTNVIQWEV